MIEPDRAPVVTHPKMVDTAIEIKLTWDSLGHTVI
jgi:hypothetical protein